MRFSSEDVAQDEWNQRLIKRQRPPDWDARCPYCDSENGWYASERYLVRARWEDEPDEDYDHYYGQEDSPGDGWVYSKCGYCNRADIERDHMRKVRSDKLWEWCHEVEKE